MSANGDGIWKGTDLVGFFEKNLIVLTESNAEDDRCDVFEAMNPFLSLTPLATNVKHATRVSAKRRPGLAFSYVLYA
jgi:hypothetical protein